MSFSGLSKFLIGFVFGISLLTASGVAAAYYFYTKLSAYPPKPIFAEEQQQPPVAQPVNSPQVSESPKSNQTTPSSTPSKSPAKEELPPGAYKARVTWPEGLSLRDAAGVEASRIGGVAYNQEIIVLQESNDKKWQKVRLAEGTQEGWVKAGNIERVN